MNTREAGAVIGPILRSALSAAGKSQTAVAIELQCHQGFITNWLRGKSLPAVDRLEGVIKAFQLSDDDARKIREIRLSATKAPYRHKVQSPVLAVSDASVIFDQWTKLSSDDRARTLRMMQAYQATENGQAPQ